MSVLDSWLLIAEVAVGLVLFWKVIDLSIAAFAQWWNAEGEDPSANRERER
jgi:hypothetical protein